MNQIKPLAKVTPIYDHDFSTYPETVRIAMDDGNVMSYRLEVKQPEPILRKPLEHFTKTCFGGYEHKVKPKRPGKYDGGASSQGK